MLQRIKAIIRGWPTMPNVGSYEIHPGSPLITGGIGLMLAPWGSAGPRGIVGLAANGAKVGEPVTLCPAGLLELKPDDWLRIVRQDHLVPGADYYVATTRMGLTRDIPNTGYVVKMGRALTNKTLCVVHAEYVPL